MMSNLSSEIVKIYPVEYDLHGKPYPRIVVYRNIKVRNDLTQQHMEKIKKLQLKREARTLSNPEHYLFYQYGEEPLIIIDLHTSEFLTTKPVIEYYGLMKVQHQASILLRLLKKCGYAKFKRIVISTYRLGDKEEAKRIFREYIRLLGSIGNLKNENDKPYREKIRHIEEKEIEGWVEQ